MPVGLVVPDGLVVPVRVVVGDAVTGVVVAVRAGVGVGVGVGLPVPVGLVDGAGWIALAPVLAGRGIQRRLLATGACEAPSRTSALKS